MTIEEPARATRWRTLWISLSKPFVVAAFRRREQRRFRQNFPRVWKTSGEIIALDLENYEPEEGAPNLDKVFIDDIVPARDAAMAKVQRLSFVAFIMFMLIVADYFSISMKFHIPSVEFSDIRANREFLLFFMSLINIALLVLSINLYNMERVIKYIINKKLPEELRQIYISKYFYHENALRYSGVNTPHITIDPIHNGLFLASFASLGFLVIGYMIAYITLGVLIAYDVWMQGNLGWLSRIIALAAIINYALILMGIILTRFRMPYTDYSKQHEIDVLKQIAPSQVSSKLKKMYSGFSEDYGALVAKGYFSGDIERDLYPKPNRKPSRKFKSIVLLVLVILVLLTIPSP